MSRSLRDRALARWAGSLLSGSMVFLAGALVLMFGGSEPTSPIHGPLPTTTAMLLALTGYVTSLRCLAKLQRPNAADPRRLWTISLAANIVVVLIFIVAVGVTAGLLVCLLELVAIALHVAALNPEPSRP